jgi:hypothetical protein
MIRRSPTEDFDPVRQSGFVKHSARETSGWYQIKSARDDGIRA